MVPFVDSDEETIGKNPPPVVTEPKRVKRADIARHKQFKTSLEKTKSGATRRLDIAVKVTLFVLLLDISVIFISSQLLATEYTTSLGRVRDSIEASHSTYAITYGFRRMNWLANGIGPEPITNVNKQIDHWRTKIDSHLERFHLFDINELAHLAEDETKGKCSGITIVNVCKSFGLILL